MRTQSTRHGLPAPGTLALLAVAEFMLTLDLSIVNVALPAIRGDLGFGQDSLQWVVNAYAIGFAGFLLLGGRAADLFGGRRVFVGALGVFTVASLACGIAAGQALLVAARIVQGISAGVLAPTTLSILTATYRDPQIRNRALAIWTGVAIGGGAIGGLAGGMLTGWLSWRWIFLVNVPVGLVLLALAPGRLPSTAGGGSRRRLDLGGAVTATGALIALVWGLVRSDAAGWSSGEVLGGVALAATLAGAFVLLETRSDAPLVPFSVFGSRPLTSGITLSFSSFLPVMATWYFLTLYLQVVRGYEPVETGWLFLPMSLAVIGGSQLSFRLLSRTDARLLFAAGGITAAIGLWWLGQLDADTDLSWVIGPATIAMIGGGLMFAPITVAATSVQPSQAGLASGLLNTSRQIGGALGLAVLGTIATAHSATAAEGDHAAALSSGYATGFEVGSAVFVATTIIGTILLPAHLDNPTRASNPRPGAPADRSRSRARRPGR